MANNNTKAMLQAMLSGKPTKEMEKIKIMSTQSTFDKEDINKAINESNLPSVDEVGYSQYRPAGSLPTVTTEGIQALLSGKGKEAVAGGKAFESNEDSMTQKTKLINEKVNSGIVSEGINKEELRELVEDMIYDTLAEVMGGVNNNLKNKDKIRETLTEAVTFIKLKDTLKG